MYNKLAKVECVEGKEILGENRDLFLEIITENKKIRILVINYEDDYEGYYDDTCVASVDLSFLALSIPVPDVQVSLRDALIPGYMDEVMEQALAKMAKVKIKYEKRKGVRGSLTFYLEFEAFPDSFFCGTIEFRKETKEFGREFYELEDGKGKIERRFFAFTNG